MTKIDFELVNETAATTGMNAFCCSISSFCPSLSSVHMQIYYVPSGPMIDLLAGHHLDKPAEPLHVTAHPALYTSGVSSM